MPEDLGAVKLMDIAPAGAPSHLAWVWVKDSKVYPFVRLDSKLAQRLNGFLLIRKDLNFAEDAFGRIADGSLAGLALLIRRSVWAAGVIAYAKCYTNADGRNAMLDRNAVFEGATQKLRDVHDWIMQLRHKYMAHAGGAGHENANTYLALKPGAEKGFERLYHDGESDEAIPPEAAKEYLGAVAQAQAFVESQLNKLYPALMEETKQMPIDKWYARVKIPG